MGSPTITMGTLTAFISTLMASTGTFMNSTTFTQLTLIIMGPCKQSYSSAKVSRPLVAISIYKHSHCLYKHFYNLNMHSHGLNKHSAVRSFLQNIYFYCSYYFHCSYSTKTFLKGNERAFRGHESAFIGRDNAFRGCENICKLSESALLRPQEYL